MSLQGLPDFYKPIQADGYQIYYPYENVGDHFIVPNALKISDRPDGSLDFLLDLVRGEQPNLPPSPYGILDFRVQPNEPIADALIFLRQQHPQSNIRSAVFSAGFLRLHPIGRSDDFLADLLAPIQLAWNGLGNARVTVKLTLATALLLKGALEGNALSLSAYAEMELEGVAPRLPLQIRFNPNQVLSLLASLADPQRQIARSTILQLFRQDLSLLPIAMIGEVNDPETLAETLTDWVRVYFATFTPTPNDDAQPYLTLNSLASDEQQWVWDLSQPLRTQRPVILSLNPLEAAQTLVHTQGIDTIVRTAVIPSFSTGILPVSVSVNLPTHRPNILSVGVTLRAPPFLPHRPQASIATAELTPPDDRAQLLLRLSPSEPAHYAATAFVVVSHAQGIKKFKSPEIACHGNALYLKPDQFPVIFLPIEAERSLLELASVEVICKWVDQDEYLEDHFELHRQQPSIALWLPKPITDEAPDITPNATLEITARSLLTDQTLSLGPISAKPLKLGLHSFREYGPQTVQINCQFESATSLVAIDLLPEDCPIEEVQVFSFTSNRPQRHWTYFVRSPFQTGYRYRLHSEDPNSLHSWSVILSPFEPLNLSNFALEVNHAPVTNGL